jgi:hypothetical protein
MLDIGKFANEQLRQVPPMVIYELKKYYRESWEQMEALHSKYIYRTIISNLNKGIESGHYRADINPDVIAKLYVGKSFLLVDEEIFPVKEYERQRLFREFIHYHLRGIVSAKGQRLLDKFVKE